MIVKVISLILMLFMLTSCGSKTSIQTTGESSENVGVNSVRPDETLQVRSTI